MPNESRSGLRRYRDDPTTAPPVSVGRDNVLGILFLSGWSVIIVISLKYLVCVMRADNETEGAILALMQRRDGAVLVCQPELFGAALLNGDGVITPAISVLSAVEELSMAPSALKHFVIPITIGILLLFIFQRVASNASLSSLVRSCSSGSSRWRCSAFSISIGNR